MVGVGLDRDLEGRNEASGEQRIGGDDAIGQRKALSGLGGRRRQVDEGGWAGGRNGRQRFSRPRCCVKLFLR